jgi:capsular polysaccharide export protein
LVSNGLHSLRCWLDYARLGGVLLRIRAVRKDQRIALGFFVNARDRGVHAALCPGTAFIRVNFARARRGWTAASFTRTLKRLAALTSNRPVEVIVWGYRDRRDHGVDVAACFDRCWRVERALIEPPATRGNAFLADYRSVYFDGRGSTDLERRLNALKPGELPQSPDGGRLLAHILDRSLSKYQGAACATARPTARDLLIVGQCTGDQAIEETDALARDNPSLVDLAAKHLLVKAPGFERVYFKPHPRNGTTPADLAYIRDRYPRIEIVDGNVDIASVLEGRPAVATLTSGAGLEAAVRGCKVHTFGVSFYSHWGFTTDHMPPCGRRTNRLSAADVLLCVVMKHTRYVDPRSGEPMTAMQAFGLVPSPAVQ